MIQCLLEGHPFYKTKALCTQLAHEEEEWIFKKHQATYDTNQNHFVSVSTLYKLNIDINFIFTGGPVISMDAGLRFQN